MKKIFILPTMKFITYLAISVFIQQCNINASDFSLDDAHANHADDYIIFPTFYSGWNSSDSEQCLNASFAVHPSFIKNVILNSDTLDIISYTPICPSESSENPHVAVKNKNNLQWELFSTEQETLFNPLFEPTDFNATHISDEDLLFVSEDNLWMIFRVTWAIAGIDSNAIFITGTENGIVWSAPKCIISDGTQSTNDFKSSYISPSIIKENDGSYSIYLVEPMYAGRSPVLDTSRVLQYTALTPDGVWEFLDTCMFFSSNDTMKIWHIEIVPLDDTTLVALVTQSPNDIHNFGDSAELYLSVSFDNGENWVARETPVLSCVDATSNWDNKLIYRSSGDWLMKDDRFVMELYYSAKSYETNRWQTGKTYLFFDTLSEPTPPMTQQILLDSNSISFELLPEFNWLPSVDPDLFDTVNYKLEISDDLSFTNFYSTTDIATNYYNLEDSLEFSTHYWWRVTAIDKTGLTVISDIKDFWTWTLGDMDNSHYLGISDLTFLVDYLFNGGQLVTPKFVLDINGSCNVGISDLTYLVEYLFNSGEAPSVGCE